MEKKIFLALAFIFGYILLASNNPYHTFTIYLIPILITIAIFYVLLKFIKIRYVLVFISVLSLCFIIFYPIVVQHIYFYASIVNYSAIFISIQVFFKMYSESYQYSYVPNPYEDYTELSSEIFDSYEKAYEAGKNVKGFKDVYTDHATNIFITIFIAIIPAYILVSLIASIDIQLISFLHGNTVEELRNIFMANGFQQIIYITL